VAGGWSGRILVVACVVDILVVACVVVVVLDGTTKDLWESFFIFIDP
jgi:hypothetical protein